jgi:hypothetical protein
MLVGPNDQSMMMLVAAFEVLVNSMDSWQPVVHRSFGRSIASLATNVWDWSDSQLSFSIAPPPVPLVVGMAPRWVEPAPASRPAPSWVAEFDQLVARLAHFRAVVRVRIRDQVWATFMASLPGDPTDAIAEDESAENPRPERKVTMPDAPRRALPRETRAGPEPDAENAAPSGDEDALRGAVA